MTLGAPASKGPPSVVEEDPVLFRPVSAVGHDDIEIAVAVHVAQVDGRREPTPRPERPQRPERPFLLTARAAGHGQQDGEPTHRESCGSARAGHVSPVHSRLRSHSLRARFKS